MSNAWYEVLSVLHLMAMLSLSQANLLLLPRTSPDGYQPKVSEGNFLQNVVRLYDMLRPIVFFFLKKISMTFNAQCIYQMACTFKH